jgi:hypothetical protein
MNLPSLRTAPLLHTLLIEVGNVLIEMMRQHVDSASLFKSEPPEVLLCIDQAAQTL